MDFNSHKHNLSSILSKIDENIVKQLNPIYFKIYLLRKTQKKTFSNIFKFQSNLKDIEDYLNKISNFLGFLDKNGKLSALGKYFCFSTNILEDFYRLIILNDEDFYNFIVDLKEKNKEFKDLNTIYLSNFFLIVSKTLETFFSTIGLIQKDQLNQELLNSWTMYKTQFSERFCNIILNILNIIDSENFLKYEMLILEKFNNNQKIQNYKLKNQVKLLINVKEFEDFKNNLKNFFKMVDFQSYISTNSSFRNTFFKDFNFFGKSVFKDSKKEKNINNRTKINEEISINAKNSIQSLRNQCLRNILVSLYYECQICAASSNKIPKIINQDGDPYLEVHHIIPLSYGDKKNKWSKFYKFNQEIEKILVENLDNPLNMITLCPHHHRMLHFEYPKWVFQNVDLDKLPYFTNIKNEMQIFSLEKHFKIIN